MQHQFGHLLLTFEEVGYSVQSCGYAVIVLDQQYSISLHRHPVLSYIQQHIVEIGVAIGPREQIILKAPRRNHS